MSQPSFLCKASRNATCLAGGVALLLAAGCGRQAAVPTAGAPEPAADPGVLAVVDGRAVTEGDFQAWWGKRPAAADSPKSRQEVMDQLIERSALAGAARRAGLDRDPGLAAEIDRLLIARLQATQLQERLDRVEVSEADLAAEYERGRTTRYHQPERVRVAVLWFETRGQEPLAERYRPRLEAVRAQVRQAGAALPATNGFGDLARTHSEHRASRFRGGDVGWLPESGAADPWGTAVRGLAATLREPGDLSEVSATPAGLFLVRLIDRQPGADQPFAAVREQIRRTLRADRRRQVEEQFRQEILQAARVERPPDMAARVAAIRLPSTDPRVLTAARTGAVPVSPFPTPVNPSTSATP